MKTLPLAEAKAKLSSLVDKLKKNGEDILITKNGRAAAILLSPEEYESLTETVFILSQQDFLTQVRKGISSLKAKKAKLYSLEDLFED